MDVNPLLKSTWNPFVLNVIFYRNISCFLFQNLHFISQAFLQIFKNKKCLNQSNFVIFLFYILFLRESFATACSSILVFEFWKYEFSQIVLKHLFKHPSCFICNYIFVACVLLLNNRITLKYIYIYIYIYITLITQSCIHTDNV